MTLTNKQIRNIRLANKIAQKDFAELVGIPVGTYSNIELGNQPLYADTRAHIVKTLNDLDCDFSILNSGIEYPKYAKVGKNGQVSNSYNMKEESEVFAVGKCDIKEEPKTNDPTHPEHYHKGGMDLFQFLELKWTGEQMESFYAGNVLKYVLRYNDKNGVEDLEKAKVYIDKLIQIKQQGE